MSTTEHESSLQNKIRLEASRRGVLLFRNNVGAAMTEDGRHIRFGLANDSSKINKVIKSSDLIGIKPVVITQEMVGQTIGQFVALEVKRPDWRYMGTAREKAQLKFLDTVTRYGGEAKFINSVDDL